MESPPAFPPVFDAPRPVKLTVADFAVLHDAGALDHHHRSELIEGVVTEMSPQRSRHSVVNSRMLVRLELALAALGGVRTAMIGPTVAIPPHNAPEPDIVITDTPDGDGYVPLVSVALVVEVSDSTLRHDLSTKRDLYARAGIPEYWVVDVAAEQVHQFWAPAKGLFANVRRVPLAGPLASATLPGLAIDGTGL